VKHVYYLCTMIMCIQFTHFNNTCALEMTYIDNQQKEHLHTQRNNLMKILEHTQSMIRCRQELTPTFIDQINDQIQRYQSLLLEILYPLEDLTIEKLYQKNRSSRFLSLYDIVSDIKQFTHIKENLKNHAFHHRPRSSIILTRQ
jgi:hypothetical protein